MKLQKQVAYRYKDKLHYKYVIIVPEDLVAELKWKDGQELKPSIDGNKLLIEEDKKL